MAVTRSMCGLPSAYMTSQPQPAAVASMTTCEPLVVPSSRPGRSSIENVTDAKSASGSAASHSAFASATAASSASWVSARSALAAPLGAGALAVSALAESSLVIVTVAELSAIVAPTALDRLTTNVSLDSCVLSGLIEIVIVCDVTPAANVSVPDFAV